MNRNCDCFSPRHSNQKWRELICHPDNQDRTGEAWQSLLALIDQAVQDNREVFDPKAGLGWQLWKEIQTLPKEIAKLTNVKHLLLYGSQLSHIPPEIGKMASLEEFTPYTSYNLHWFPYEITRCTKLADSRVSTRALYGNDKNRPPFPRLRGNPVQFVEAAKCSICGKLPDGQRFNQVWVSLRVGTDILPLLAHICSFACHQKVTSGETHKGGLGMRQSKKRR